MDQAKQPDGRVVLQSTINADYDERYSGVSPWRDLGAKYKAKNLMEVCNRADFKPRRILEVGAGEGSVLKHMSDAGFGEELHALEIANSGVEVIRSRNIPSVKSVEWFDGYSIPYEDDAFDAVILCHVLEHVEYERILLREVRRVAPYCILEVPLDYHDGIDERYEHCLSYGHINVYSTTLIRFLL
ncbi:MAG: class I SAM-dependent methyltransferase, partial [Rhodospirillaceae bacterium]